MKVVHLHPRGKCRNRAAYLNRILDRRIAQDATWAKFRVAIARLHDNPSPVRHVEAHDARLAWVRTWR